MLSQTLRQVEAPCLKSPQCREFLMTGLQKSFISLICRNESAVRCSGPLRHIKASAGRLNDVAFNKG